MGQQAESPFQEDLLQRLVAYLEHADALCGWLWAMTGVESEERCLGGR